MYKKGSEALDLTHALSETSCLSWSLESYATQMFVMVAFSRIFKKYDFLEIFHHRFLFYFSAYAMRLFHFNCLITRTRHKKPLKLENIMLIALFSSIEIVK